MSLCFQCQSELLDNFDDGATVCVNCGATSYGYINAPEFNTQHQQSTHIIANKTTYKRPNHFKKILASYPQIKIAEANLLYERFTQLQRAFEHQRGKRHNMLPYRFVIYKLCELLGYSHHLPKIRISKSKTKLWEQTKLWDSICKELDWRIPINEIAKPTPFHPVIFPLS